jgi:hypothetical protein
MIHFLLVAVFRNAEKRREGAELAPSSERGMSVESRVFAVEEAMDPGDA